MNTIYNLTTVPYIPCLIVHILSFLAKEQAKHPPQPEKPDHLTTQRIPTMTSMMEELAPLPEWFEFGTALKVQREKLVEIERGYHLWGQRRYNIELFHHWLQWCCDPTWEKIAHALEQAGVDDKARAVRAKYCEKSAGKGLLAGLILHWQLVR